MSNMSTQDEEELIEELRQGSEARHYANRHTPDGTERVEMVSLEWVVEVVKSREQSIKEQAKKGARLSELDWVLGRLSNIGRESDSDTLSRVIDEVDDAVTALHSTNNSLEEKI